MFELIYVLVALVFGLIVGGVAVYVVMIKAHSEQIINLRETLAQSREALRQQCADKTEEASIFKQMSVQIADDNSRKLTEQNKDNINTIVAPLREQLKDFERRINELYDKEQKERHTLGAEITNLRNLNERISKDAINLTNALKGDVKQQGCWGELILERVLEQSGLTKGLEYQVQVAIKDDGDGSRKQPDVIVSLPEDKKVIIDAKVSLVAYERYCVSDCEQDKQLAVQGHIASLRAHIKRLSNKEYHKLAAVDSLDFVLMFMPIEASLSLAMHHEPQLLAVASANNIILVTPTTLLATLRTIRNLWRYEQQNKNAKEIANQAGSLYDKFVGFTKDLLEVGKKIEATQVVYQSALKKLDSGRGSLVKKANKLKILGANTNKSIPEEVITDE